MSERRKNVIIIGISAAVVIIALAGFVLLYFNKTSDFSPFESDDIIIVENQYPDISGCADEIMENFDYCDKRNIDKGFVYLDGERIFFQLYNNRMGKDGLLDNYLYEYLPESNNAEFVSKFSHSSGSSIEEIISLY